MAPSPRFKLWAFYLAFTVIQLNAIFQVETDAEENLDDASARTDKKWGAALSILCLLGVSAMLFSHSHIRYRIIVIDTKIEFITIALLLLFSTILVALVSGPSRGLAVDKDGAVFIGNMYYFSWGAFFIMIMILSSFIESAYGINVRQSMTSKSSSFTYWSALLVTSLIVMGTSSNLYNQNCDVENDEKPQPFCKRCVLAITVGTLGVLVSLAIVALKLLLGAAPFLVELCCLFLLFILYSIEILYVTGARGPGSPLGNLYYFSWISFLLVLMVAKACYEDYVEAQEIMEQQQSAAERTVPTLASVGLPTDEDVDPINDGATTKRGNTTSASNEQKKGLDVDEDDIL